MHEKVGLPFFLFFDEIFFWVGGFLCTKCYFRCSVVSGPVSVALPVDGGPVGAVGGAELLQVNIQIEPNPNCTKEQGIYFPTK